MKSELLIVDISPNISCNLNEYSTDSVQNIHRGVKEGLIVIDYDVWLPTRKKNLQREFVWNPLQKSEFMKSILKTQGYAISKPSNFTKLSIVTTFGKNTDTNNPQIWEIIDGKQRLSTVLDYMDNKIPILHNQTEYFFDDLNKEFQCTIKGFWFNGVFATIASEVTDDDKVNWFGIINYAGTAQDISHFESIKNSI